MRSSFSPPLANIVMERIEETALLFSFNTVYIIREWDKSPAINENLTRTRICNKMLWTSEQLIFVTIFYFTHGKSIVKAQRSFEMKCRLRMSPSKKVITRCVKNFSESGNLDKKKSKGRPVTATDGNNVATAKQIIEKTGKSVSSFCLNSWI